MAKEESSILAMYLFVIGYCMQARIPLPCRYDNFLRSTMGTILVVMMFANTIGARKNAIIAMSVHYLIVWFFYDGATHERTRCLPRVVRKLPRAYTDAQEKGEGEEDTSQLDGNDASKDGGDMAWR